jgi:hypothetical protein
MLGATAEHAELKPLEKVLLYDKVRVIDETIGLDTQLTVTEIEWDALKTKITAMKISNAEERGGKNVTGYNVKAKSIGWSKLTDEVQGDIMRQVQDIIPEYADPNASRPATVTVTDSDPTLVWGTRSKVGDVQGTDLHVTMPANPDTWRPVQDNLNSQSATDSLSAKQGRVLNNQKTRIYKTVADAGIQEGGTLADFIKAMDGQSYAQISVTNGTTFSDVNATGELYVFKPSANNIIHKSLIFLLNATQTTTDFTSKIRIGFIKYSDSTVVWYTPTLTAI